MNCKLWPQKYKSNQNKINANEPEEIVAQRWISYKLTVFTCTICASVDAKLIKPIKYIC